MTPVTRRPVGQEMMQRKRAGSTSEALTLTTYATVQAGSIPCSAFGLEVGRGVVPTIAGLSGCGRPASCCAAVMVCRKVPHSLLQQQPCPFVCRPGKCAAVMWRWAHGCILSKSEALTVHR